MVTATNSPRRRRFICSYIMSVRRRRVQETRPLRSRAPTVRKAASLHRWQLLSRLGRMSRVVSLPEIVFTTPRHLPDARKLRGRVAVVDIAFAADGMGTPLDRKSTRLNSSHRCISYAVFCLKKKKIKKRNQSSTQNATRYLNIYCHHKHL